MFPFYFKYSNQKSRFIANFVELTRAETMIGKE